MPDRGFRVESPHWWSPIQGILLWGPAQSVRRVNRSNLAMLTRGLPMLGGP